MVLYNTLTRKKEQFKPIKSQQVGLYTCGLTVYDYAHIGNLRTFIFEDILRRALQSEGYAVRHIMNITDIDDKTIEASAKKRESLKVFTARYTNFFKTDIKKLNILPPKKFALATQYIKKMIFAVEILIKKGLAYEKDGSVYFKILAFKNYGRLSGLDKRELKIGATVENQDYDKENPADFVLWKAWQKKDGKVFWNSPWGKGRPGWHLECAIIATEELGESIDIHAGGVDLIFPHHENEIAEAEGMTGKPFARYWFHAEHLLVDDKKMSKSLKNFYTLKDLEEKGYHPLAYRYLCLQTHYSKRLNFSYEALDAAQIAVNKLNGEARELWNLSNHAPKNGCKNYEKEFYIAISDDLNAPKALGIVWEMLKSDCSPAAKLASLLKFDKVFGLSLEDRMKRKIRLPQEVRNLLIEREDARKKKKWDLADTLRKKIAWMGYEIEDTPEGPKIIQK